MTALLRLIVATTALTSANAFAFSFGTVTGRLLFYQNQGNYCPSYRDCTGAKYLQSQFNTNMPVAQAKVYMKNLMNQVIGQGVTDTLGYYSINWFDGGAQYGSTVTGYLAWNLEHQDGRFAIHDPSGNNYLLATPPLGLTFAVNTSMGTYTFGNSGYPNRLANLYDGAWRSWYYSLSQSARQLTYNTNVEIRAFGQASIATCYDNKILMDEYSAFKPQGRILHEMGHIASCRASDGAGYIQVGNGCTCYGGICGWGLDTVEYGSITFEEAFATFFGDVALYGPTAVEPYTCITDAPCSSDFNLEGSGLYCGRDGARQPINNVRYFWDLYDTREDFAGETTTLAMAQITDAIQNLPDGYDNNAKNEPWWGGIIDDCDGRSSQDYWVRWWLVAGIDTSYVLSNNCGPIGD